MEWSIGLISILTSLLLFLVVQLIAGIWWASRITTTLSYVQTTMEAMTKSIQLHDANLYAKTDAARDFAKRDVKMDSMFSQVENNRNDITELRTLIKK